MNNYIKFTDCMDRWNEWFDSDSKQSVLKQVQMLLFETFIYKYILKARELTPIDEKGIKKLNNYHHWLIDKCYFQTQAIAIRRLVDGRKDSISILKLIDNIEKHKDLLTRSNYCKYRGFVLNVSKLVAKENEYVAKNKIGEFFCVPDEIDPFPSQEFHKRFDKLSETNVKQRSSTDKISVKVFHNLKAELEQCKSFAKKVSKTIAHTDIRSYHNPPEIYYREIFNSHKILCKILSFMSFNFLGPIESGHVDYGLLILPRGDWLKYISEPLVLPEKRKQIRDVYDIYRKEINSWKSCSIKDKFL